MTAHEYKENGIKVDLSDEVGTPQDMKILSGSIHLPQRFLQGIGAALLLFLTAFVTVTVIMRYLGNGVLGAVEIASLSMVIITVLVIPAATAADENFRVEVVDFFVGEKTMSGLNILSIVVQLVVSIFLATAAIDLLIHDLATRTTMAGELSLERWLLSLPVAIGFIGTVYSTILIALRIRRGTAANTAIPEG